MARKHKTLRGIALVTVALATLGLSLAVFAAVITGNDGPDTLEGTPENDTLKGGGGADTMMGLGGDDTYYVNQADDDVIEGAEEGIDLIRSSVTYTLPINVENLKLTGTRPINGTGNELNNRLIGNAANNALLGGKGNDTMIGGVGDDRYGVNGTDVVIEAPNEGLDTIHSSHTFTLPANVENLTLNGTAPIRGFGNDLANVIAGNGADNRLDGGPGNDILTGGEGGDEFWFTTKLNGSTNVDRIRDFNVGEDSILLSYTAFPEFTRVIDDFLYPEHFMVGPSATTTSHLIVYNPQTGALYYDSDGSGPAPAVRFATLLPNLALTAGFSGHFRIHPRVFL